MFGFGVDGDRRPTPSRYGATPPRPLARLLPLGAASISDFVKAHRVAARDYGTGAALTRLSQLSASQLSSDICTDRHTWPRAGKSRSGHHTAVPASGSKVPARTCRLVTSNDVLAGQMRARCRRVPPSLPRLRAVRDYSATTATPVRPQFVRKR